MFWQKREFLSSIDFNIIINSKFLTNTTASKAEQKSLFFILLLGCPTLIKPFAALLKILGKELQTFFDPFLPGPQKFTIVYL
jgi:hypothetical protein